MQTLYRSFRRSVASLDRQGDENVFQQVKGRYTSQLKMQLNSIAAELMSRLDSVAERNEWSYTVNRFVQDYLQEFGLKIRSL